MLLFKGKNVFFRMLSLVTNGMGSFVDVVWVVFSVKKTIRGVSYPAREAALQLGGLA